MKPQIDLRWQCQQNSTLIFKALNKSAEEKSKVMITETMFKHGTFMFLKVIKLAEEYIELMQQEGAHHHECLDTSSTSIKLLFQQCHHPGAIFQPTLQMPLFIIVLTWHNRYIFTSILYTCWWISAIQTPTNTKVRIKIKIIHTTYKIL